jgi:Flp pilus assembly protein TadD
MALLAASLGWLFRKRALGFVGAWFFFTLGPTSSIMPITSEIAAERRMYLPLLALTAAAVVGGWRLLTRATADPVRRWQAGASVTGLLVLVLGTLTLQWNIVHYSVEALWRDTIRKRPGNARAHSNLSVELLHQGRLAESIAESMEVVRLAPDHPEAHYALGLVLRQAGWTPEAARSYHETIRLKPGHAPAHSNLGVVLDETGRTREAIREYWIAIQLDSAYPDPHNNLGVALEKLGFRRQAIGHYRQAILLSPGYAMARKNLGEALINEGRIEEGRREIAAALALKPDHPGIQACWKRASALPVQHNPGP